MSRQTALFVEDNRILAKMFSELLKASDELEVKIVYDGREAQAYLQEETPGFIIIDLHIPKVSGVQLIQEISADDRFCHAKLIVMTADTFLGGKIKIWHPRVDVVLFKPIPIQDLLNELKNC